METSVLQTLNDPLAQDLLDSTIPARLAYTDLDGFPRAIPIAMYAQRARIVITPTWTKLLDFQTRIPTFMERLVKERGLG